MYRATVLPLILVAVVATPAAAKRVAAPPPPLVRAIRADATLVGKVTAIEKETVAVAEAPSAPKAEYHIAVVKVDTALAGTVGVTHVKIGFVPPPVGPDGNPVPRRGFQPIVPKVGQEALFFLQRHPSGSFFVVNPMMPPVDATSQTFKSDVASVQKALGVLASPLPALKAEKAEDRYFAAAVLVTKYRTYPDGAGDVDQVKVPAAESLLILKGLAEGDWVNYNPSMPNAVNCFYQLALTEKDGFVQPKPQPGENYQLQLKAAFTKWITGPGQSYQLTRMVPKK